jgi:hypothetical protein
MKKGIFITLLFLIILPNSGKAQLTWRVQAGLSYLEHFSTGITFGFATKHTVSLLYGSNFFIRTKDFSSYLVQYEYKMTNLKVAKITPGIGVKGGHSVYTSDYYKWEVAVVAPFTAFHYPVNEKIDIRMEVGGAISLEQSVKRIRFGEIEKYKELLPEFKAGILYRL